MSAARMFELESWRRLIDGDAGIWLRYVTIALAAIVVGLVVHAALFFVLRRASRRTASLTDDAVVERLARPARWLFAGIALAATKPAMDLGPEGADWWRFIAGLTVPALFGWLAAAILGALNEVVQLRTDISASDNLLARRRRTRIGILHRIGLFLILICTACLMLMSIPAVRAVGVTLAASAGIGALAVGAAAQPALKNIIAGMQMAFTEPIRLDDVVIVDGEWGRIEEIRLTYVVVAIWDQRRLVVPVSKFLEENFQNWTRNSAELLGTAFIHVDRTADIGRLRAKLTELVAGDPLWDGRVCGLQVTDSLPGWLELRCLVSAADAARAFDLRCNVREGMAAFIAAAMPEALPRARELIALQPVAAAPSAGVSND